MGRYAVEVRGNDVMVRDYENETWKRLTQEEAVKVYNKLTDRIAKASEEWVMGNYTEMCAMIELRVKLSDAIGELKLKSKLKRTTEGRSE